MPKAGKCISCGKRPIDVKKWKRCKKCYQRYIKIVKFKDLPTRHASEMEFVKCFFDHRNWKYQPANFRFDGDKYQPDFYDGERNAFIEVVGTRSAFYANRQKYIDFRAAYPKINFEIRQINGDLIDLDKEMHFNEKKIK